MLNLLILTIAGILAYLLAYLFNYLDKCRYKRDLKRVFKSDLNRHQAIKVMQEAKRLMLDAGFTELEATANAINYCSEVTDKGLLHEKYLLLRGA